MKYLDYPERVAIPERNTRSCGRSTRRKERIKDKRLIIKDKLIRHLDLIINPS